MKDQDIKVEKKAHNEGFTYSHPSFGMVKISRGSGLKAPLFGSEIEHGSHVSITVSHAEVTQDLGRNWYFSNGIITEAILSPVQYADLISNPNTEGVPCTIRSTETDGYIKYKPIETVTEHVESVVEEKLSEMNDRVSNIYSDVSSILDKKGALNKSDKESIKQLISKLHADLGSNMDFYQRSHKEALNKQVLEAKSEIEAVVLDAKLKLGERALNNAEAVKLLLNDK